uniref:Uncharacterized protein n=1 Tax=Arundo donax TaxID=35708 RepID=A0A0A9B1B5_ARUDO
MFIIHVMPPHVYITTIHENCNRVIMFGTSAFTKLYLDLSSSLLRATSNAHIRFFQFEFKKAHNPIVSSQITKMILETCNDSTILHNTLTNNGTSK